MEGRQSNEVAWKDCALQVGLVQAGQQVCLLMKSLLIAILLIMGLSSCSCPKAGQEAGGLFSEYVSSFEPDSSEEKVVPELEKLPDSVYEDVLALKASDEVRYRELVCELLLKYHNHYLENFRQTYSLANPHEMESREYAAEGNNRFFLLRCFMEFSNTRVRNDGFPTSAVKHWYEMVTLRDQEEKGAPVGLVVHVDLKSNVVFIRTDRCLPRGTLLATEPGVQDERTAELSVQPALRNEGLAAATILRSTRFDISWLKAGETKVYLIEAGTQQSEQANCRRIGRGMHDTRCACPGCGGIHHRYIYDAWNRLVAVVGHRGGSPAHDGLRHRTLKTDQARGTATCNYPYNTNWQALEVREDTGTANEANR